MRIWLLFLVTALAGASTAQSASCNRPWIFFDLGDVLVDTHDWDNLSYKPGALAYVRSLRIRGYKLGLIVNIPESWGANQPEKLARLQTEIATPWREPLAFPWRSFEVVLLPPSDALRKPDPYLFEQARLRAGDCPAVFQGENSDEVLTAERVGLIPYLVGAADRPFFMPIRALPR